MFWTEEKLAARIKALDEYRYRDVREICSFRCKVDHEGRVGERPNPIGEWFTVRIGEKWSGRDLYLWLATEIEIPSDWAGRKVLGRFDFGRTGAGSSSGFESLLYLNGLPYQGVDSNHQEVFLPENVVGTRVQLDFRLWSGLEGGGKPRIQEHELKRAEICWLDTSADDLYYTAKAVLETVQVLPESAYERTLLLEALDCAFREVDWSEPGSELFYASLHEAIHLLRSLLDKIERNHLVTVTCVGHSHIDVAWLWRLRHTREKVARSFATALRLMEQFPEFVFLQTQPQLYEYLKTDYPDIYAQMKERIKEKRWEAAGGMWLEADCNLPCGESLVRQILMGTKFLQQEFGVESKYLWLPDTFGFSASLPQIMKKSGLDVIVTTKLSWNQYNRMPHDTFRWRGIDGTEVLAHFITTPEPTPTVHHRYTYNGQIRPSTVQGVWNEYRNKNLTRELLLAYGYGDGGGGVNREMLEMRRRLEDMPGMPRVVPGRVDEYFARLKETLASSQEYIHTWDGELYLEYHRGTYTSQAYNKRKNRELEILYRKTEWLCVVCCLFNQTLSLYPKAELDSGWKMLLRNQFHDILPGSSIQEVYADSRAEYEAAETIATQVLEKAVQRIVSNQESGTYVVFNSSPWKRSDLVCISTGSTTSGFWVDRSGNVLQSQRCGEKWLVLVPNIPSMGWEEIRFQEDSDHNSGSVFYVQGNTIRTPFYEIQWDEHGHLTRIYDLEVQREVLAPGTKGNVFQVFEDKPLNFDAWDIDLFYQEKMREVTDLRSFDIVEWGPLRMTVRFKWTYGKSTIQQEMALYQHSRRIDFVTIVDWNESNQLMKVAFPVNVRATEATYDIQFGNVKRPTHWNTSWDYARFETVAHQWVDLSEYGYGVSLLNNCKYGHDVKDNVLRLSLIKSATYPDVSADRGIHRFTYALLPHCGDWVAGGTVQEAWALNDPLTWAPGSAGRSRFSMFSFSADTVMIDAVKKAEDEDKLVLRLHDFSGGRRVVRVTSDLPIRTWQECDLLERPIGAASSGGTMEFELKPYEIKTFLIEIEV